MNPSVKVDFHWNIAAPSYSIWWFASEEFSVSYWGEPNRRLTDLNGNTSLHSSKALMLMLMLMLLFQPFHSCQLGFIYNNHSPFPICALRLWKFSCGICENKHNAYRQNSMSNFGLWKWTLRTKTRHPLSCNLLCDMWFIQTIVA